MLIRFRKFGKSGKILTLNDTENPKFALRYQIASGLCGPLGISFAKYENYNTGIPPAHVFEQVDHSPAFQWNIFEDGLTGLSAGTLYRMTTP